MQHLILLNDLLRLPTERKAGVKAKFNKFNGEVDPLDEYLEDPGKANATWLAWRGERSDFAVGQTVVHFMLMRDGCYLLTAVRKVTGDTGVANSHAYSSEDIPEFLPYCGRVVVLPPDPPIGQKYIQYYQTVVDRLFVHEILPEQYSGSKFPGVNNIRISLTEIRALDTRKRLDWINALNHQKGVYLITDKKTGKKYVGSAYGAEGLWQRWLAYCYTGGHGGNVELIKLLKQDENYGVKNFEFAVLETFGSATPDQAILEREQWWKETLRTELNRN